MDTRNQNAVFLIHLCQSGVRGAKFRNLPAPLICNCLCLSTYRPRQNTSISSGRMCTDLSIDMGNASISFAKRVRERPYSVGRDDYASDVLFNPDSLVARNDRRGELLFCVREPDLSHDRTRARSGPNGFNPQFHADNSYRTNSDHTNSGDLTFWTTTSLDPILSLRSGRQ